MLHVYELLDLLSTYVYVFYVGTYEKQPGSSYKHWYFNATFIAYKMWCLIVIGFVIGYETFKYVITCVLEKDIR